MMNTTDIQLFVSAAQSRNFSQAAAENYISRQAVSRRMFGMEKELGIQLFVRAQRGQDIALTPEGQKLLEFFLASGRRWEALMAEIRGDQQKKTVQIAYLEGLDFAPVLENLLQGFQERYGADVSFSTYDMHDLSETLASDSNDLIVTYNGPRLDLYRNFSHVPLLSIPMVLVAKRGLVPEAQSADDFSDLPVVTWLRKNQTREEAIEKCTKHCMDFGFHCKDVMLCPNRATVNAAIELGQGIGICTAVDLVAKSGAVETYPLQGVSVLACLWRKNESHPVVRAVVEDLRKRADMK